VSPVHHAQLAVVAQIDEITLTDLIQQAFDAYLTARRTAPDFQAKAAAALAAAEAQMAQTRAMLLGTLREGVADGADTHGPAISRRQRKDEASG